MIDARSGTGWGFERLVRPTDRPFLQSIYDPAVPETFAGRACVIGDAAFFIRPHVAAGTAHAATDALTPAGAIADLDAL